MLKCGQKDNKNYTFGVTSKQMQETLAISKIGLTAFCLKCNCEYSCEIKFCEQCGSELIIK